MFSRIALAALVCSLGLAAAEPVQQKAGAKKPDAPNGRYEIDPIHSSNWFRIRHMNVANFYGRFDKVGGKLFVDGDAPAESMINLVIDVSSVDTNNAERDAHIKGPDFFNVAEFKEITFDSEKVTPKDATHFEVTGTMKMHGVEKEITVPVEQTGFAAGGPMGTVVGYEAHFTLKRADFGLGYAPDALGADVEFVFSIEGTRK